MAKTFQFERFEVGDFENMYCYPLATSDGEWVKAEDAINRETVNVDRIRTLELQLKEQKERADREYSIATARGNLLEKVRRVISGEL